MRFFVSASLVAHAAAFSPALVARPQTALPSTHIDKSYTASSGMTEHDIALFIENLSPENFEESLEMLEPLLTNECVGDM